jgi:hypothetical protein
VEYSVVSFGAAFLVVGEGIDAVEHGRLISEDLGVLDEVLPLNGVQLLEVFEERDASVLIRFTDNLSE